MDCGESCADVTHEKGSKTPSSNKYECHHYRRHRGRRWRYYDLTTTLNAIIDDEDDDFVI